MPTSTISFIIVDVIVNGKANYMHLAVFCGLKNNNLIENNSSSIKEVQK